MKEAELLHQDDDTLTKDRLMTTTHMSTIEAKEAFSDLINRVTHHKERIILTRRGKEIAAIIPIETLHDIENAQNKQDLEDAVEALKEARQRGTISLEDLNQEIG